MLEWIPVDGLFERSWELVDGDDVLAKARESGGVAHWYMGDADFHVAPSLDDAKDAAYAAVYRCTR